MIWLGVCIDSALKLMTHHQKYMAHARAAEKQLRELVGLPTGNQQDGTGHHWSIPINPAGTPPGRECINTGRPTPQS